MSTGGQAIDSAHKRVIFASSLGTVFEWYDFYLYGSLAAIIARQFFSALPVEPSQLTALGISYDDVVDSLDQVSDNCENASTAARSVQTLSVSAAMS